MRKLFLLLLLLIPNICCAQYGTGPYSGSGSSSGSTTIICADTGVVYARGANTPSCTVADYYYDYTNKILHVPAVQTASTNTPQTQYTPSVTGDTIFTAGVTGNGDGVSNDNYVVSEGSTLGSNNRISIAPGGVVTIPTLTSTTATVTTINLSTITSSSDTLVNRNTAEAVSNKTIIASSNVVEQMTATTDTATPTPTGGSLRNVYDLTALAQAATFAAPSGTPANWNKLTIRIKDNATARALSWNSIYVSHGPALPTTTILSKIWTGYFMYDTANSLNKWCLVGATQEQ